MKNNITEELQVRTRDTALDFLDAVSKKGPREFLTKMGELSIRSQELRTRRYELDTELEIARTELRKAEIAKEKARIIAEKEMRIKELETEKVRIEEQSKCLQKLMETSKEAYEISKEAYDRKFDFYDSMLKSCMDYFSPQIQSLEQQITALTEQCDLNSENQKTYMMLRKELKRLTRSKDDINDKVEGIISNLTTASKIARLDFDSPIAGYIK